MATKGDFLLNENGCWIFKIVMEYIETPSTKTIKICFTPKGTYLRQNERPGYEYLYSLATSSIKEMDIHSKGINNIINKLEANDIVHFKLNELFNPSNRLDKIQKQ